MVAAVASIAHANNVLFGYATDPLLEHKEAVRLARLALRADDNDSETLAIAAVSSAFMVGDSESDIEPADRVVLEDIKRLKKRAPDVACLTRFGLAAILCRRAPAGAA